jgi:hypothetical protein
MTGKQTQMAMALTQACISCAAHGGNPGRIGHRVLTNNAKINIRPPAPVRKKESKAESAVVMK